MKRSHVMGAKTQLNKASFRRVSASMGDTDDGLQLPPHRRVPTPQSRKGRFTYESFHHNQSMINTEEINRIIDNISITPPLILSCFSSPLRFSPKLEII